MRSRSVPKRHHIGTLLAQFDPLRPLCCRLATSDPLGTPPNSLPRRVTRQIGDPGFEPVTVKPAVQRENQCATCTKCMKICGFDWLMMSGHHDGMNGHTHMVRVIHSWRGSLRPPPLMEHFGTLSPEVYRTGPEVFPIGATSVQTCADFHFDPLSSTSIHFEPYSRL
jgi:hypothetical protein